MNIKALLPPVFAMCLFLAHGSVASAQNPAETEKRDEQRAEQADSDDSDDKEGLAGSWFEGSAAPEKETAAEERAEEEVVEELDPVEPGETTPSPGQSEAADENASSNANERNASDRCLVSTVEAVLEADRSGRSADLSVDARGGVVSLSGALPDQDSVEHVRKLIGSVKGVSRVETSGLTTSGTRNVKD